VAVGCLDVGDARMQRSHKWSSMIRSFSIRRYLERIRQGLTRKYVPCFPPP
jgi:hypothetical protein